jgi:hypothetical protein
MDVVDVTPAVDAALIEKAVYFIRERQRIIERKAAGEPRPWSLDPLLNEYRFTSPNVQDDRVSTTIFNCVTKRYADHPQLIVALTVCRFTNDPEVIKAVCHCLAPLDDEQLLAIMRDRAARKLSLERRSYIIPGGVAGELKAANLTRKLFVPLAKAIEQVRPRPGDTCEAVFERLRKFEYLGAGFLAAQIVRDLKQVSPLREASDWMTFVQSGPGSQRGLNRMLGWTRKADIDYRRPEAEWRELFELITAMITLRIAVDGIVLDNQSLQNCWCEIDKYLRYLSGDLRGARLYRPAEPQS